MSSVAGYCTRVQASGRDHDATEPDEYVVARMKEALAHDGRVAALDVEVRVTEGKVLLEGAVQTEERRLACAEVVRAVLRDCTIDNRLVVVPADAPSAIEDVT
jgi:osmotically-inducible protein OsmY